MKRIVWMVVVCLLSAQTVLAGPARYEYDDSEFEDEDEASVVKDPFEKFNRKVFTFNKGMDVMIFRPVDKVYRVSTPSFLRKMIHNVVRNLREPVNFINGLLQLDPKKASNAMGRFVLNSTWGLAGVSDVAGYAGINYSEESLGKTTLSKYKVKPGPYIVLPILGPSTMRDSIGMGGDIAMDPFSYTLKKDGKIARLGVEVLDGKDGALDLLETIEKTSLDEYAAIRSLYTQKYR